MRGRAEKAKRELEHSMSTSTPPLNSRIRPYQHGRIRNTEGITINYIFVLRSGRASRRYPNSTTRHDSSRQPRSIDINYIEQ